MSDFANIPEPEDYPYGESLNYGAINANFKRISQRIQRIDILSSLPAAGKEYYGHDVIVEDEILGDVPYMGLTGAGGNYTWSAYQGDVYDGPTGPLLLPVEQFATVGDSVPDDIRGYLDDNFDKVWNEYQKRNVSANLPVPVAYLRGWKWYHESADGSTKFVICCKAADGTYYWKGPCSYTDPTTPVDPPDPPITGDPDPDKSRIVIDRFEPEDVQVWQSNKEGNVGCTADETNLVEGTSSMRVSKCVEIDNFDTGTTDWSVTGSSCQLSLDATNKEEGVASLKIEKPGTSSDVYVAFEDIPTLHIKRYNKDNGNTVWSETWTAPYVFLLNMRLFAQDNNADYVFTSAYVRYFTSGTMEASRIEGRNISDGSLEWARFLHDTPDSTGYSYFISDIAADDTHVYCIEHFYDSGDNEQRTLYKLNNADGTEVWSVPVNMQSGDIEVPRIALTSDSIIIAGGRHLYKYAKSNGGQTFDVDVKGSSAGQASCVVLGDYVYTAIDTGFRQHNVSDGATQWTKTLAGFGQLSTDGTYIHVVRQGGNFYRYDVTGTLVDTASVTADNFQSYDFTDGAVGNTICGAFNLAGAKAVFTLLDSSLNATWSNEEPTSFGVSVACAMSGSQSTDSNDMAISKTFATAVDLSNQASHIIQIKSTYSDVDVVLEVVDSVGGTSSKTWNITTQDFTEQTWDISTVINDNKAALSSATVTVQFNTAPAGGEALWLDIWQACPGTSEDDHKLSREYTNTFNLTGYDKIVAIIRGPASGTIGQIGFKFGSTVNYFNFTSSGGFTANAFDITGISPRSALTYIEMIPPDGETEFADSYNIDYCFAPAPA